MVPGGAREQQTTSKKQRAIWARSRVRLGPSNPAEWTLVDVGGVDQAGLDGVAAEVTALGPGLL